MPSVASMILRASRDAGRAARSAASSASRCAVVVACSGSGGAAVSDPLLPSFSIPFDIPEDKDRESDEALWALYERWCNAFNQKRDHDEMSRQFNTFKETVLGVDRTNKADLPYRAKINQFADGIKVPITRYYQRKHHIRMNRL